MTTQEKIEKLKSLLSDEDNLLFEEIIDDYKKQRMMPIVEDEFDWWYDQYKEYDLPLGRVSFYTNNLSYQQRLESYITKTLDNTQCDLAAKRILTNLRRF